MKHILKKSINILLFSCFFSFLCINEVQALEIKNLEETYLSGPTDTRKPYLITECNVFLEKVSEQENAKMLWFKVENISGFDIYNWGITYEAEYSILGSTGIEVVQNDSIKQLVATSEHVCLKADSSQIFSLEVDKNSSISDYYNYRLYGYYKEEQNVKNVIDQEVLDFITYDVKNDSLMLNTVDVSELEISNEMYSSSNTPNEIEMSKLYLEDMLTPSAIIGTDNRVKINTVTVSPYYRVAYLYVTFPDGSAGSATGFMINDKYMLTSAHVVYDSERGGKATSVTAYFGVNGTSYTYKRIPSQWSYSAAYTSSPSAASDWACLKFDSSIGNVTGWFSVGYISNSTLENTLLVVCGYPGDKAVSNSSGINGKARYMYISSCYPDSSSTNVIYHTADASSGMSGAPLYVSTTKIVYGIHSRGSSSQNQALRISQTLYNSFVSHGWID